MNWNWRNFWKAIGALLGTITAGIVITAANIAGLNIDPEVAAAIASFATILGTLLAPKNVQAERAVLQDEV